MSIDPSHVTSFRLPPNGRATEVDFGGFGDGTSVSATGPSVWGEDGFTISDLVDLVNPLQHIPVVSTIYRALTGDDIAPAARILGGSVLGGPLGFAASVVNVAIEDATDRDIGGHVWAWLNGEDTAPGPSAPTAVASNAKPSSSHADVEPMMLAFAPERGQRPGSGTGAASGAEPGHTDITRAGTHRPCTGCQRHSDGRGPSPWWCHRMRCLRPCRCRLAPLLARARAAKR